MQSSANESACGDPSFEKSLLDPAALAQWRGSPLDWIEDAPHAVQADLVIDRNVLVMIDSGATQADFRHGGKAMSWEFTAGSIGFFPVGTEIKRSHWRWSRSRRIVVALDAGFSVEALGPLPRQTEFEFRDQALTSVVRAMVAEAATGSQQGPLFAESLSLGVAMRLHRRATAHQSNGRERGKLTEAQSDRVQALVETGLRSNIALSTLAAAAGYSPAQFVRLFKNSFGVTPYQYVLRVRLKRARTMLLSTSLPLTSVAMECGFSSQSHMTAAFMRSYGITPGEMRRQAGMSAPEGA